MQIFDMLFGKKYMQGDEKKTQWINIGTVFRKEEGKTSGVMHSMPLNWDGSFIIKERKARGD
jgi:hypothetical protein